MLAHEVLVEKQLIQPPFSMECPKIDIQSLAFDTENLDLSFEKQTENPNIRRKLVTTGLLCYTNVADFSLFFLPPMADLPRLQVTVTNNNIQITRKLPVYQLEHNLRPICVFVHGVGVNNGGST